MLERVENYSIYTFKTYENIKINSIKKYPEHFEDYNLFEIISSKEDENMKRIVYKMNLKNEQEKKFLIKSFEYKKNENLNFENNVRQKKKKKKNLFNPKKLDKLLLLKHPNVIEYQNWFKENEKYFIVSKFIEKGNLLDDLQNRFNPHTHAVSRKREN